MYNIRCCRSTPRSQSSVFIGGRPSPAHTGKSYSNLDKEHHHYSSYSDKEYQGIWIVPPVQPLEIQDAVFQMEHKWWTILTTAILKLYTHFRSDIQKINPNIYWSVFFINVWIQNKGVCVCVCVFSEFHSLTWEKLLKTEKKMCKSTASEAIY